MAGNANLNSAAKAKKDEFYTQLADIENELRHYKRHFRDKVVFCNCDDPYESNFFKFFAMNFNSLGLRKLIATCYATSPIACTQLSMFDCGISVDKDPPPENLCLIRWKFRKSRTKTAMVESIWRTWNTC